MPMPPPIRGPPDHYVSVYVNISIISIKGSLNITCLVTVMKYIKETPLVLFFMELIWLKIIGGEVTSRQLYHKTKLAGYIICDL